MKVRAIETIRIGEFPNLLWTRIHTDEGVTGLGESYFGPDAVEAHIHAVVAPYLLGKDPLRINEHYGSMVGYLGQTGSSAEQRGRSSADMALWDILGKATDNSVAQLLGGRVRDSIRVYNTCASTAYNVKASASATTFDYGRGQGGPLYDDLDAFLDRPEELAGSLLEMGITAMKIWPFDFLADDLASGEISTKGLAKGIEPFARIRRAFGNRMDIAAELHGLWSLPSARRIMEALRELQPLWVEDPVPLDQMQSVAALGGLGLPRIGTGEALGSLGQFKHLIDSGGCGLVIFDITWSGGITGARKVAALAEAAHLPVAFHDCTGPVVLAASTQLALATRNCPFQEIARAYYLTWYQQLTSGGAIVDRGQVTIGDAPGLGVELDESRLRAADVVIRRAG